MGNKDSDALMANVQRLQEYMSKLVVIKGDKSEPVEQLKGVVMPVVKSAVAVETRAITADEKKAHVYREMAKRAVLPSQLASSRRRPMRRRLMRSKRVCSM